MTNKRRTLAIKIQTPGGDNPLRMQLVGKGPFFRGIAVANLALVAQGGTAPYAFSIVSGGDTSGGINGLTLNTDGTFSGVPDSAGRFTFVARVADANSQVFTHSFSLTFKTQLFIVAGTPTPGEIDLPYSYRFIVRDANGVTLTSGYALQSGNLPAGLSLNTNGLLTGTPTAPDGISYFAISATGGGETISIPCVMTIYPILGGHYLEDIDPPEDQGGGAGSWLPAMVRNQDWIAHLVPTGGCPPYSIKPSSGSPPPTGIKVVASQRIVYGRTTDTADIDPRLMSVWIDDALGNRFTVQRALFIIEQPNTRIIPRLNGSDVSNAGGFSLLNLEAGDNVQIEATSGGGEVGYRISATGGGGGGGIQTIEGVEPGSSGDLSIRGVEKDSNGELFIDFPASGGGVQTINGLSPDGLGNIVLESPDHSVRIYQDSNGDIGFSVTPIQIGAARVGVITTYSSAGSFTWNKAANSKIVEVICVGGGGGGGGGASVGTNGNAAGGSGGGGAAFHRRVFRSSDLASSVSVNVGAGGGGGNGRTGNPGGVGADGVVGGTSNFGTLMYAYGGGPGSGNNNGAAGGGGGGIGGAGGLLGGAGWGGGQLGVSGSTDLGFNGNACGGAAGGQSGTIAQHPGGFAVEGAQGGGSGAGTAAINSGAAYGQDGAIANAGVSASLNGTGTAGVNETFRGNGASGGGCKYNGSAGTNAGNGGAGQQPGGGGGGGGGLSAPGSSWTSKSGNGGAGGDGIVVVIEWF